MAKQTFTTGQVLTAAQMTSLQQTAMGGGSATAKTANYVLVAADAGTTIIMNAAGATTITVNTSLFSSGDTVFIQNIGAGTCTVTAGTATVSTAGSLALTQYEGGTLYFTATGAAIFNDFVQASGSASALTLIAAPTTFSASSAVNVNNVFSATYENYLILVSLDSVSVDDYFQFRTRVSGSDETGSNYNWALMANSSTSSGYDGGAGSANTSYRLSYIGSTGSGAAMVINVNNPFLTKYTSLNVQSNANFSSTVGFRLTSGGMLANTTSYTGFTLFPASGTATGKVAVYGYSI